MESSSKVAATAWKSKSGIFFSKKVVFKFLLVLKCCFFNIGPTVQRKPKQLHSVNVYICVHSFRYHYCRVKLFSISSSKIHNAVYRLATNSMPAKLIATLIFVHKNMLTLVFLLLCFLIIIIYLFFCCAH